MRRASVADVGEEMAGFVLIHRAMFRPLPLGFDIDLVEWIPNDIVPGDASGHNGLESAHYLLNISGGVLLQ